MNDPASRALAIELRPPTRAHQRRLVAQRVLSSPLLAIPLWSTAIIVAVALPSLAFIGAGIVGIQLLASVTLTRSGRRLAKRLGPAMREAEMGSYERAYAICIEGMEREPYPLSHICALTIAYLSRRQGQFESAIEVLGRAAKSSDKLLRQAIGVELAVCYSLKGATGPAMMWLPEIASRHHALAASIALVWARTGKLAEIKKLRVRTPRDGGALRHEARVMAVLQAYARFHEHPDYLSIRPLLLEAGPAYESEFDYLGVAWPEMKEFIDTYVAPPPE